jgi:outer membrane protein
MNIRQCLAVGLCVATTAATSWGQEQGIAPVKPAAPVLWRPYLSTQVPPVRLVNTGRLGSLVRAGKLYLSAQDAIVLALENNIDIEIARYGPIVAAWRVTRSEAGGALPGVPSGTAQANAVTSGQGVLGSQSAAGVNSGGGSSGRGSTNAQITQIGPVTQTLDPAVQQVATFSHRSVLQPNNVQSGTSVLVQDARSYAGSIQQGLLSGGSVTLAFRSSYLNENAVSDYLNPSVAPSLALNFQHNLLRGFGIAVNARTITISKMNLAMSDPNFRTQVTRVVVQVLRAYYGLVAAHEDLKSKQSAVDVASVFLANSKRLVELGSMAEIDLIAAEREVANAQLNLVNSQTALRQQEITLKNLLSRTGLADPVLAATPIIPVDRIDIPAQDDLPSLKELVAKAMVNRTDLEVEREGIKTSEVSALGTQNGVLPTLVAFGGTTQSGLAGTARVTPGGTADPYFAGGLGTALGQVMRRNFPTENIGVFAQAQIRNRQAQADQGIDQLQLRQSQFSVQKSQKQAEVDLVNAVVVLEQARVRHEAALHNRTLAQQLLTAEQKKLNLGSSTPFNVISQQRDLAVAEDGVVEALVAYSNARIVLDQTLGTTLESNHVSIEAARSGQATKLIDNK